MNMTKLKQEVGFCDEIELLMKPLLDANYTPQAFFALKYGHKEMQPVILFRKSRLVEKNWAACAQVYFWFSDGKPSFQAEIQGSRDWSKPWPAAIESAEEALAESEAKLREEVADIKKRVAKIRATLPRNDGETLACA